MVSPSTPFLERKEALQSQFQGNAEIEVAGRFERFPYVVGTPTPTTDAGRVRTLDAQADDFLLDEPHRLRESPGISR